MNITVTTVKENADGSADCNINFDAEGLEFMIQFAITSILKQYAQQNPMPQPDKDVHVQAATRKKNSRTKKTHTV